MEVDDGTPAKTPAHSPTPSMTPSPTLPERSASDAPARPFKGLGKETLRAVGVPIKPEDTRILLQSVNKDDYLPGQPRIRLSFESSGPPGSKDEDEVSKYLRKSHLTTRLDELMPFMKYIFVQTPNYRHIKALHHQAAHARQIIVNENPGLHLLWYYDRIFVKPIPAYFLSAEFWVYLRSANNDVYRAAVGFMRTYHYLIQYELDYDLACEHKLIPRNRDCDLDCGHKLVLRNRDGCDGCDEYPTYAEFCRFIEQFGRITDHDVCRRYHYGELRLTRINRTAFLRKGSLAYFHIYPQWGSYLRHFFAPIFLVLGGASVILNAMQVNLNAQEILESKGPWLSFVKASLYFPVVTITLIAAVMGTAMVGAFGMTLHDLARARDLRKKRRNGEADAESRSHGLI